MDTWIKWPAMYGPKWDFIIPHKIKSILQMHLFSYIYIFLFDMDIMQFIALYKSCWSLKRYYCGHRIRGLKPTSSSMINRAASHFYSSSITCLARKWKTTGLLHTYSPLVMTTACLSTMFSGYLCAGSSSPKTGWPCIHGILSRSTDSDIDEFHARGKSTSIQLLWYSCNYQNGNLEGSSEGEKEEWPKLTAKGLCH